MDNLTIDTLGLHSSGQLLESALACDIPSDFSQLMQELLDLDVQAEDALTPFQFSLLGQRAWNLGLLNEAVSLLTRSFDLEPKQPVVLQALGVLLIQLAQPSRAKPCLELALTLDSNLTPARLFLGELLISEKCFQAAVDCLEHYLSLDPSSVECLTNLALALRPLGRLDDAITRAEQALELAPDNAAVHYNLALLLLNNHNWASGWYHHEWRLSLWSDQGNRLCIPVPNLPPWGGENQSQTKLVLVAEQGLGDSLHFVRYAPYLQKNLAELRLCVPDSLVSLISYSYPNLTVVAASIFSLADDEDWIPFLSAPHHFGISPEASPIAHPYLQAPDERQQFWSSRLKRTGKLLIGLHWQGNPNAETSLREGRSFPLEALAPLSLFPELEFVSLQKGPGSEQVQTCSFHDRFVACQDDITHNLDFIETAAIVQSCDLIITTDSGLAHLAGALSAPTWLLLHCPPDWRWGKEAESTHWYPTLRIFRQALDQTWAMVIQRVFRMLNVQFPILSKQVLVHFCEASSASPTYPLLASFASSNGLPGHHLMPDHVTGYVINLDVAKERWHFMSSQLESLGWASTYKRFNALTATKQEANALGLRTAGELGLWRTTIALLNHWLDSNPRPTDILHVLEDDAILHSSLPTLFEPFQLCVEKVDILFTETGLSSELYLQCSDLMANHRINGFDISLLKSSHYLYVASSYVITPAGARKLLHGMLNLETNMQFAPIDLAIRQLMHSGQLKGSISLPFFTTISTSFPTQIQSGMSKSLALSKNVDLLLRRLFYFKHWEPGMSGRILSELFDLLAKGLVETDLDALIVSIIGDCHAKGLLPDY